MSGISSHDVIDGSDVLDQYHWRNTSVTTHDGDFDYFTLARATMNLCVLYLIIDEKQYLVFQLQSIGWFAIEALLIFFDQLTDFNQI